MADVDIIVGAQDQASKILQEIAGETRDLGRNVTRMAKQTQKAGERMEVSFKGMASAGKKLLGAFLAFRGVQATFRGLSAANEAFAAQQGAVRGLTRTLELAGETVGPTIEEHKKFAASLQDIANIGDEVTLALMTQVSTLGISNEQMQGATVAALGLSEALEISTQEALKKVNAALAGNFSAINEYLPQLQNMTSEQEKFALVMEVANKGLVQAQDRTNTGAGAMQKAANSWGDFMEVVGQALEPMQVLIGRGITVLAKTLSNVLAPAVDMAGGLIDGLGGVVDTMTEGIVRSVTFVEVVVGNLPKIWELMTTSATLQIIRLVESFKHSFTVVIPAHAAWFGENFVNLVTDAFNAAVTVVSNAATNIKDILVRMWDFVASGFEGGTASLFADIGEIAGRSLLEGFETQTGPLPDIADRRITATEQRLMATMGRVATDLGDEFNDKVAARMGMFGQQAEDKLQAGVEGALAGLEGNVKMNVEANVDTALTAVASRFLTRGDSEDAMSNVADNTKKANDLLRKIEEHTKPQPQAARGNPVNFVEAVG